MRACCCNGASAWRRSRNTNAGKSIACTVAKAWSGCSASSATATGASVPTATRLIRGLLAVLLARVDGIETRELARLDLNDWFTCLGLSRQLSPSRSNGLNAVLQRMRELSGQTAG